MPLQVEHADSEIINSSFLKSGDTVSSNESTFDEITIADESTIVESCRVALTTVASPSGHITDPEPVSTWAFIESRANRLFAACLTRKLGGGFALIAGLTCTYQPHRMS